MKQKLHALRKYIKHEPRGFKRKLLKNSINFVLQKYVYGKKFGIQKIHTYKMKLDLRDPGISRTLFLTNDREREHAYLLKKIIRPGDTVLDLGANIGYYALMESELLENSGRVIAIEPHPANFKLLKENISLNDFDNITPIHAAVTEHDGTATLHVSKLSNVHSVLPSVNHAAGKSIDVPSLSLPTIIKKYGDIQIIRMDIEGFETKIIQSILDINQHKPFKPSILFEIHAKKYAGDEMNQLLKKMANIGYKVRYLATSDHDSLRKLGLPIQQNIPTDGKIRHIIENVSLDNTTALLPSARCLVLSVL